MGEKYDAVSLRNIFNKHPFVEYANPIYRTERLPHVRFSYKDKLLIRVGNGVLQADIDQLNDQYGVEEVRVIPVRKSHIKVLRVRAPFSIELLSLVEMYTQLESVEHAGPNWVSLDGVTDETIPNDPYFDPDQWGLHQGDPLSDTYDCDIDAPLAWDITKGTNPVIIGILDTGIYFSPHNDPDVENIHYDFLDDARNPSSFKVVDESEWYSAVKAAAGDPDTFDVFDDFEYENSGHGTCVSGVAAAAVNSKDSRGKWFGIAGLAWSYDIKILPIKSHDFFAQTTEERICLALRAAINRGAHVINMSWHWAEKDDINLLLDEAYEDHDIFLVASAGNENKGFINYPASHPYVMAIGASVEDDKRWIETEDWGSHYGPKLDVVAPGGHNICAPYSIAIDGGREKIRCDFGGTSAAAPIVAGLAGLLRSYDSNLNKLEIWEFICRSAEKVRKDVYSYNQTKEYGKWNNEMGYGRVNAFWALLQAGAGEKGDMNRDMSVDLLDPPVMLDIILGYDDPDDYQQWAGDMNYDGEIDLLDYMLLWDKVLYGEDRRSLPEIPSEPAIVYLSKVPGPTGAYSVMLENSVGVAGVQLWISYNPQAWTPGEPQTTDRSAMLELNYRNEDGELMVMLASPRGDEIAPGDGPIFFVSSQKPGGSLHITRAILCTATGQEIPVVIKIMGAPKSANLSLPGIFMLSQNYPNPFNPETEIRFQLSSASHTSIKIFNILGQEVKTMVNEQKEAGFYSVMWDGRDDWGFEVASGVYFYRITTGRFSETKRMLLLK